MRYGIFLVLAERSAVLRQLRRVGCQNVHACLLCLHRLQIRHPFLHLKSHPQMSGTAGEQPSHYGKEHSSSPVYDRVRSLPFIGLSKSNLSGNYLDEATADRHKDCTFKRMNKDQGLGALSLTGYRVSQTCCRCPVIRVMWTRYDIPTESTCYPSSLKHAGHQ